jgi:hypothetical protein
MKSSELLKYFEQPQLLDDTSLKPLKQLVEDFPYFQGAHILLSLAARKWDASVYQQSLKRTAISVPSRTHLFNLIHGLDDSPENSVKVAAPAGTTEPAVPAREELDILKAAEVATEVIEQPLTPAPEKIPGFMAETAPGLEKEISRQVVTSFVEKEIINTPALHKVPAQQTGQPESFGDWLAFLKKNNGLPVGKVAENLNAGKLRLEDQRKPGETSSAAAAPAAGTDLRENRKLKNKAIIDRIIEKNPGLIRTREEQKFYAPEARAKESLLENEHLMTETLARIYALQGNIGKAVRAYEILSLKYPQKSAYFATLIQQLKNNNNDK